MMTVFFCILIFFIISGTYSLSSNKKIKDIKFELTIFFIFCIMFGIASAFIMGDIAKKEMRISKTFALQVLEDSETGYIKIKQSATTRFIAFKKENSDEIEELEFGSDNIRIVEENNSKDAFLVVYDLNFKERLISLFCFGNFSQHRVYEFHIPTQDSSKAYSRGLFC